MNKEFFVSNEITQKIDKFDSGKDIIKGIWVSGIENRIHDC